MDLKYSVDSETKFIVHLVFELTFIEIFCRNAEVLEANTSFHLFLHSNTFYKFQINNDTFD